jgi:hypothetical protein
MTHYPDLSVPRQWSSCIKLTFLHPISMASAPFINICTLATIGAVADGKPLRFGSIRTEVASARFFPGTTISSP